MAKKYNKEPCALQVPKEDSSLRGIALAIIAILVHVMARTLAVRLVSILLIAAGYDNRKVALLVGCHQKTVKTLRKEMDDHPVSELMVIKPGSGRKPKASTDIIGGIVSIVKKKIFFSLRHIADHIYDIYKIKLSETSVGRILKRFNIRRLKCGSIPAKADPDKQREFYENKFSPLIQRAKANEIVLLFMDASHFVMGNGFLGYVYGVARRFNRTLELP